MTESFNFIIVIFSLLDSHIYLQCNEAYPTKCSNLRMGTSLNTFAPKTQEYAVVKTVPSIMWPQGFNAGPKGRFKG